MERLPEYLRLRREELEAQAEPLRVQLKVIEDEIVQLNRISGFIGERITTMAVATGSFSVVGSQVQAIRTRRPSETSMRTAVLSVLAKNDGGLTARDLLPLVNDRLGTDYPRSSLSPQLSRLKADNVIGRDGMVWRLVARKDEAATQTPEAAGVAASYQQPPAHDREAGSGGGT